MEVERREWDVESFRSCIVGEGRMEMNPED